MAGPKVKVTKKTETPGKGAVAALSGGPIANKKWVKWALIGGGQFLFLAIIGGAFYALVPHSKKNEIDPNASNEEVELVDERPLSEIPPAELEIVLDPILVNVQGESKEELKHLTIEVQLRMDSTNAKREVAKRMNAIRDELGSTLSSKSVAEIEPLEARGALKAEILESINGVLEKGKATRINFREFEIQ